MFNRDGIFSKKEENGRKDVKPVSPTPGSAAAPSFRPPTPAPAPAQSEPATSTPPQVEAAADEHKGSRLTVGPDIKLKGVEITDCDTLVVEGRVEAAMDSRVIQIAESGMFSGTVGIDMAVIRGRFEGELTARGHLLVHSTGKVTGKIRYGSISIEEGGEVSGDIGMLTATSQKESAPRPSGLGQTGILSNHEAFARNSKAMK